MENKNTSWFNKMQYVRTIVNRFIHQTDIEGINKVYSQLMEQLSPVSEQNEVKRRMVRTCKNVFLRPDFRRAIQNSKSQGIANDKLINIIVNEMSAKVLGRHYNMSKLSSDGKVSVVKMPNGDTKKLVAYKPRKNSPTRIFQDINGNPISIQLLGTLHYATPMISEFIEKYRITRNLGDNNIVTNEVFTEININQLSDFNKDSEYYNAVMRELLSLENIKYSGTNGYIGELIKTPNLFTHLKPGMEHFEENENRTKVYNYTYQISPNYALYYDCEKFEAVKAYVEQEKKKNPGTNQFRKDDER